MNYLGLIMESDLNLGDRLRLLINHLGMSVAKFAREIDVPQPTITSYLNDSREPGVKFLYKIKSKYRNINLNWLVTGEGNIDKEEDRKYEDLKDKYYNIVEDQLKLYKKLNEIINN